MNDAIACYLSASAAHHSHLCPRQVLGVRIALAGLRALGMDPAAPGRLMVILEMDGCFADGVLAVCGVSIGKRTLRIEDYGKIAATFINFSQLHSSDKPAVRVSAHPMARQRARAAEPDEPRRYFAQLRAYQTMADSDLLLVRPVILKPTLEQIISRPGIRVSCTICGEDIHNQREIIRDGKPICRACAGAGYFRIETSTKQ